MPAPSARAHDNCIRRGMPGPILIADDDAPIRNLLAIGLRRAGCAVDFARNGAEALERIAANDYALVLLDGMMPVLSGFEVVERIAALEKKKPSVFLLTAAGDLPVHSLDCSVVLAIISKPFDLTGLVDLVCEIVGARPAVSEPSVTSDHASKRAAAC